MWKLRARIYIRDSLPCRVEGAHLVRVPQRKTGSANDGVDGPKVRTPLSLRFYAAYVDSGLSLESIARRAGLPLSTVAAYINGTRGMGRQGRQRVTLTALARALGLDVDDVLEDAGFSADPNVIKALRSDP